MSYEVLGVGAGVLAMIAVIMDDSPHSYLSGAVVLVTCGISVYVGA